MAMPFLILTRAGFEHILPNAAGATLYINPSLLAPAEIEQLRAAGAEVQLLSADVDPKARQQVDDAVTYAATAAAGPVWVESGAYAAAAQPAVAPTPVEEEEGTASPVRSFAESAGKFALQAIKRAGRRLGQGRQLMIVPYASFGSFHRLLVRGRVLEMENFRTQAATDTRWRNMVELYKRLESDEVAGAGVIARFQGQEQRAVTDAGGYFNLEIELAKELDTDGWINVELELDEPAGRGTARVTATAQVLVPPPTARFGVISDIDDTVLWSNVTNKLNMMRMLARSNSHTRKPFKGVGAFYRALHAGASGGERNPVFYVSSSPWHLYGPLTEFFKLQGIPLGPLLLKELGMRQVFGEGRHHTHKLEKIEMILRFYPNMKFVLMGDSGEQDPELYSEAVRRHPQAIRVIYIRNVNPDPARIDAIDKLVAEVSATGAQLILTPDSVAAATHAAGEGLIDIAAVAAVRADKREDETTLP
ncbi:App1 family protein [Pseudoduganella sp. GCM10020061]|uniref:App1 family protein n=1 Tax=Pseudoduganella sp. GCM10020061 TaxID=3317345 RepID=UPI00364519DC